MYATLDQEDCASVRWERSVRQIRSAEQIGTEAFAAVFDFMFNRIEFAFQNPIDLADWIDNIEDLEDDSVELEYDSDLTHCHLKLDRVVPKIEVTAEQFSVVYPRQATIQEILVSYVEVRDTVQQGLA